MPWDDEVVDGLDLGELGYPVPPPREAAPEELPGFGKPVNSMASGWDDEVQDPTVDLPLPGMAEEGLGSVWGSQSRAGQLFTEGARSVGKSVIGGLEMGAQMAGAGTPETGMPEDYDPNQQNALSAALGQVRQAPALQPPADFKPPEGLWEGFIYNLPQVAGQVAAGALGGPVASSLLMFGQIAGGSYNDLKEQGVSESRAVAAGMANALLQTPLEQLGLDKILNVWKPTKTVVQKLKEYAIGAGTEGVTEFLQKFPEEIAHLWAKNPQSSVGELAKAVHDAIPQWTLEGVQNDLPIGIMMGLLFGSPGFIKAAHLKDVDDHQKGRFSIDVPPGTEGAEPGTMYAPDAKIEAMHKALGEAEILTAAEQALMGEGYDSTVAKKIMESVQTDRDLRAEAAEKTIEEAAGQGMQEVSGHRIADKKTATEARVEQAPAREPRAKSNPDRGGTVIQAEPIPTEVQDQLKVILRKAPFLRNKDEMNLLRKYKIDTATQEKTPAGPRQETKTEEPKAKPKVAVYEPGTPAANVGTETVVNDTDVGGVLAKIISDNGVREELQSIMDKHGRKSVQELFNSAKVLGRVREELKKQGVPDAEARTRSKDIAARYDKTYQEVIGGDGAAASAPSVKTPVLAAMTGKPYPSKEAALREASINSAKKRHSEFKNHEWNAVEVEGGWGLVPGKPITEVKKKLVHKPKETAKEKPVAVPRVAPKTVEEAESAVDEAAAALEKARTRGASSGEIDRLEKEWAEAVKHSANFPTSEEQAPKEPTQVRGKTTPESTITEKAVPKEGAKGKSTRLEVGAHVKTDEGDGTIVRQDSNETFHVKMDKGGEVYPFADTEMTLFEIEKHPPVTKQPFMFKGLRKQPNRVQTQENIETPLPANQIVKKKLLSIDEAMGKGRITEAEADVMKGVLQYFPDAWKQHFTLGFSEHRVKVPGDSPRAHGFEKIPEGYRFEAMGMTYHQKRGGGVHDYIVLFRMGDLGTFLHELGHYFDARILSDLDKVVAQRAYQQVRAKGATNKNFGEWFADTFAEAMTNKVFRGDFGGHIKPSTMTQLERIFKRMIQAISATYHALKDAGFTNPTHLPLSRLIDDIIKNGRPIRDLPASMIVSNEIPVFHGSGKKFNEFSTDYMYSGAGSTSFGWGLYFSDAKSVAEHYKKSADVWTIDGKGVDELARQEASMYTVMEEEGIDADHLDDHYYDDKYLIRRIASAIASYGDNYKEMLDKGKSTDHLPRKRGGWLGGASTHGQLLVNMAKKLEEDGRIKSEGGVVYRATLHKGKSPTEYDYLLWHEPTTANQVEKIIKQAEEEGIPITSDKEFTDRFNAWFKKEYPNMAWIELTSGQRMGFLTDYRNSGVAAQHGRMYKPGIFEIIDGTVVTGGKIHVEEDELGTRYYLNANGGEGMFRLSEEDAWRLVGKAGTGANLYHSIQKAVGGQKEASLFLLRAGIDGVKYEAGTLMGKGGHEETTHNYVVFDPGSVTIEDQYEIGLAKPTREEYLRAEETYGETYDEQLAKVAGDFRKTSGKKARQPWTVCEPGLINKIWNDFAKTGVVHNENGLDKIADIVIKNIVRLKINADLAGHSAVEQSELLESAGLEPFTDEESERFFDYIRDEVGNKDWKINGVPAGKGATRLSDFSQDKLDRLAIDILAAKTPEAKLVYLDRVFNVLHQRSDLPSWFVRGGQRFLDKLSQGESPADIGSRLTSREETTGDGVTRIHYSDGGRRIATVRVMGETLGDIDVKKSERRKGYGLEIVKDLEDRGITTANAVTPESQALFRKAGWTTEDGVRFEAPTASAEVGEVRAKVAEVARPLFTEEERSLAKSTSRATGAVGAKAIVPRVVRALAKRGMKILDFGAGKDAAHAKVLAEEGYDVSAYDFHLPGSEKFLDQKHDMVYVSNVLNVQKDVGTLRKTLGQLLGTVKSNGRIIANYPSGPRHVGLTDAEMTKELGKLFDVKRVPEDVAGKNLVWVLRPKVNAKLFERFDREKVVHVGLREAAEKGIISPDEAAIIDGIMETFPDTWKEHFEPRFSEQVFSPTEEQAKAHGYGKKGMEGKTVHGVLLQEKIGPLKEDAKHLAVIFKHGDVTTFLHEFGEFAYRRLTSKSQRTLVESEWKIAKERGETGKSESEWFSDRFRDWWLERIETGKLKVKGRPLPKKVTQLFRRMLTAIKGVYDRIKGNGGYTGLDSLFEDIVTNGGHIKEKYFNSDRKVVIDYVVGQDPTPQIINDQGFGGYEPRKGNNSKTYVSWDPGSICPKQDNLIKYIMDNYINVKGGAKLEDLANPQVLARLYDEAMQAGVDVPCSYCYVEAARRRAMEYHARGEPASVVQFAMAKKVFRSVPYRDWLLKRSDEEIAEMNKRGGLRLFSFSDYIREAHRADVDLLLRHAEQRGLSVKAITKNPQFVEDFGDTGITINLSVDNDGYGVPWSKASELKEKFPNVKVRSVATSLAEYEMWANLGFGPHDTFVDVITPYHHSSSKVPLPEGYEDLGYRTKGGKKVEKYIEDHPELKLKERTCCLVGEKGGKCFSQKHNKQCATNCGMGIEKLSVPHVDEAPADIGEIPQEIREKIGRTDKSSVEKVRGALNNLQANWQTRMFDKLNPVKGVDQVAYMLHRLGTGVQGILETFMSDGKLRWDKNAKVMKVDTVNKGFLPWIKKLGVDGEKLLYWTIAKRAERLEGEGRENWIDATTRQQILDWVGPTASDGRSWDALNREFNEWNDSILDLAEATGLVDPAARAAFQQDYYVPFYRLFEDEETREEFLRGPNGNKRYISDGIKRLRGAEAKIGDPLENVIRNWTHLINESVRNVARAETFKVAQTMQSQIMDANGNPLNLVEKVGVKDTLIFRRMGQSRTTIATPKGDTNILSFNDAGKRVYFKVNDAELFQALYGLDQDFSNPIFKAMGLAKRLLTRGATFGPLFRASNMFRDSLHTAIISRNFTPILESAKGFVMVLRRDKAYVDLMATGGGFGSSYVKSENPHALADYVEKVVKRQGEGARGILLDTPRKVLEFWELIGEASENAARVALYAKERTTKGELAAAFDAKDLLDFTMSGNSGVVQFLIRTVPFANARMQGLYKLGRAAAADPVAFSIKGGLLALASIALWAAYKDDDRYKQLEDWDKWSSYHFWVGDKHCRLPMPFEVGALFGSMWQSAASVATGEEDLAFFGKWAKQTIFDTLCFNPVPQIIRPAVEQYYNKVTFTGRPIETEQMQRLLPGERAYPWSSDTLKVLGRQFGLPPARAEALVRGYLATLGTFCLGASDIVIRQFADLPEKPTNRIDDYPLIGGLLKEAGPARHTRYGTAFYDIFKEVDELAGTIKMYQETGRLEEARELKQENRKRLAYRPRLTQARKTIGDLNKSIQKISQDPDMSAEEKQRRIDALLERKNKLTKKIYEDYQKRSE